MKKKNLETALKDAELTMDLLHLFAKYGLVNEIDLRNSIIRKEHKEAKLRGERIQDFIIRMAEKYFISETNIDSIIYIRNNSKNNPKGSNGNEFRKNKKDAVRSIQNKCKQYCCFTS